MPELMPLYYLKMPPLCVFMAKIKTSAHSYHPPGLNNDVLSVLWALYWWSCFTDCVHFEMWVILHKILHNQHRIDIYKWCTITELTFMHTRMVIKTAYISCEPRYCKLNTVL